MIIRTAQEQNLANCCGCDTPLCDDPRIVCESVTVSLCGFTPDGNAPVAHSDPDEGDVLYARMDYTWSGSGTDTTSDTTFSEVLELSYDSGRISTDLFCPVTVLYDYDDNNLSYYDTGKTDLQEDQSNDNTASGFDTGAGVSGTQRNFGTVYVSGGAIDYTFDTSTGFTYAYTSPPAVIGGGGTSWGGSTLTYDAIVPFGSIDAATCVLVFSEAYTPTTAATTLDGITVDAEDYTGEACASLLSITLAPDGTRITAGTGTRVRYRVGVPAAYANSYYSAQWDEIQAPSAWWIWFDGGMIGTEPTPGPSLVASQSWTWGGSMATEDDQYSSWFDMPTPTVVGECRAVNILIQCYNSTRLGIKPTAYGDQIAIA